MRETRSTGPRASARPWVLISITSNTRYKESPIERRPFREGFRPQKTRVNHEIRLSPIRLVDQNNNQVGVVDTRDALRMAEEAGLDLVEIQADVRPPVCKIMDYGKFKFEQGKRDRANRAASKTMEMKEFRLGRSAKIDEHDVHIRVEQARGFLMEGHKVQFVQNFKGREMAHRDIGEERLKEIIGTLNDIAKVDAPMKLFGKKLTMILAPDKVKIEALKRKMEKAAAGAAPAVSGQPGPGPAPAPSEPSPGPVSAPAEVKGPAPASIRGPTPAAPSR